VIVYWDCRHCVCVAEGFDFGVITLLPFIGGTNVERLLITNIVCAIWEGNQVGWSC